MKTTTPPIISLPKCGFADNEGRCIPDNKLCADPMRCDGYDRPLTSADYSRSNLEGVCGNSESEE